MHDLLHLAGAFSNVTSNVLVSSKGWSAWHTSMSSTCTPIA